MPIRPPALDDRGFEDLVQEALARIPAHTPEWTNPRSGDPGRTLIELFAWLTDTLLYRANLIPERQRLAFLRLLGIGMKPATPAQGIVSLFFDNEKTTYALNLTPLAVLQKPTPFETLGEITVLPITAECYCKRPLTSAEQHDMAPLVDGLKTVYGISAATPYVTTPVFAGNKPDANGFNLVTGAIDQCLWLALLAPKKELVPAVKETLGKTETGGRQLLNVGIAPALAVPDLFEEIGPRARIPHIWEITTLDAQHRAAYLPLDVVADGTSGLTQQGVQRIALPGAKTLGAPSNDVRALVDAGVGDQPPRLDAPDTSERLVAWIRLRPAAALHRLSLSWVGINAVAVDGRQTVMGRVVGVSSGATDQEIALGAASVDPDSFVLQVEESGLGYQVWRRTDDLALAGRDDAVYSLDSEAGTVRFGNGVRGRVPEAGRRVRVALMRAGGGEAGNLPSGSLSDIRARDLANKPVTDRFKVAQALATTGGSEAETLAQAEQRIPALFRHGNRAVTGDDYRQLAAQTPGVHLGRVEVLPQFKPQQRQSGVPGIVSVMTLPYQDGYEFPNPRPDRVVLEAVHGYLDARRPIATELYVIGCEYVPIGISIAVTILDGFGAGNASNPGLIGSDGLAGTALVGIGAGSNGASGIRASSGALLSPATQGQNAVLIAVRDALQKFLWSLAPGGIGGGGWELGRAVRDRELETVVARVPGVDTVAGINLFQWQNNAWAMLPRPYSFAPVEIDLLSWQLPELRAVVVVADPSGAPANLDNAPNPFADPNAVAIPVVPNVC